MNLVLHRTGCECGECLGSNDAMREWVRATYPAYFSDWLLREATSGYDWNAHHMQRRPKVLFDTKAADQKPDAPYAFWLGKDGANPLDGTRLWDAS